MKVILEGNDKNNLDGKAPFPANFDYDIGDSFYRNTEKLSVSKNWIFLISLEARFKFSMTKSEDFW